MDRLYEKALEYKKTKLWKKLSDSQLIAVEHSDGTIGYCCIMGKMGQHIALAVYPGEEGLSSLRNLYYNSPFDPIWVNREKMILQSCISCSFENMDDLHESEKKLLRTYCSSHNIRLRGKNSCPKFERMQPYRVPWFLKDETDKKYMEEALGACTELSKRLEAGILSVSDLSEGVEEGLKIVLAKVMPEGTFQWSSTVLPDFKEEEYETDVKFSEVLAARVRRSKKHGPDWMCDVFLCPAPVLNEDSEENIADELREAPFLPLLSIILNSDEKPISCEQCKADDDYAKQFTEKALNDMLNIGKPKKITVMNDRAYNMYLKLARYLGIELDFADYCDELEEAEDQLYYSMEGGLPDDGEEIEFSEEEKEYMYEIINSAGDFSKLDDMDLFSLYYAATAMDFEIPEDKLSLLKKEVNRRSGQM
ncbi:MAG: hypothetical protein LUD81_03610 [Clostridiales bacterium]|nr:hypothetical protein [Clostridiales bacterium]